VSSNEKISLVPTVQPDVQVKSLNNDETTEAVKVEDVVPSLTADNN